MRYITATEFKSRLGYYMELSRKEDIYVTKNNKVITVLTNPENKSLASIHSLRGKYNPSGEDVDYEQVIKEEVMKRCGY